MIDKNNIPEHVAFIMDGNGRWAKERGLLRTYGHKAGIDRVKEIIDIAGDMGIKVVTFFAFSTENWDRPKREVTMLMRFLNDFLNKQIDYLHKNNIRFITIGRREPVPKYLQAKIEEAVDLTKANTAVTVVLALNYGSRQEIVDAVKIIAGSVMRKELTLKDIDEKSFSRYLYTAGLPDPDLLIRTSGEMRISNFLLWQLSYAELYFSPKFWPDFDRFELETAIKAYQGRERRFGRINANKKNN